MDKFIEYAPTIIVVIGFLIAYRVFVTPRQLSDELDNFETKLDTKFVHKEAYDIVTSRLEQDVSDIKTKIDKIYEIIMERHYNG